MTQSSFEVPFGTG